MRSEIGDGGLPIVECGCGVGAQELECRNQICGFGDVEIQHLMSVLVEDGALRVLEEDVVERIASLTLVNYGSGEVVVHILRFPVGERKSVFVEYGAVDDDAVACWGAHRILWDEGGVHLFCTGV